MLVYWFLKLEWFCSPDLQKTEAKQQLIQAWFCCVGFFLVPKLSHRGFAETALEQQPKKIFLSRKQFCWKLVSPDGDIPAQRGFVPAEICCMPQPIPLKPGDSAVHGAAVLSLPCRIIQCCSSDPSRDLFTTWTSHTCPSFRRKAGHIIHPTDCRTAYCSGEQ